MDNSAIRAAIDRALGQLRHAYHHGMAGNIGDQPFFAAGLIAPAIRILERAQLCLQDAQDGSDGPCASCGDPDGWAQDGQRGILCRDCDNDQLMAEAKESWVRIGVPEHLWLAVAMSRLMPLPHDDGCSCQHCAEHGAAGPC